MSIENKTITIDLKTAAIMAGGTLSVLLAENFISYEEFKELLYSTGEVHSDVVEAEIVNKEAMEKHIQKIKDIFYVVKQVYGNKI